MSRADKKSRHEAKRKAKRLQIRRQRSISPLKRLADTPGQTEYWMSKNLEELGQVQAFVYKRAAGMTGIACFLVDRGVVGLKDAWARMHIERQEFDDMLEACSDRGIPMSRATVEDVRRVVAGGIRWAHQNGMRLPHDWAKPASLVGGVGDWASADISGFVSEFAGHPEDLRQRLVGESFDSYIRRPDVSIIFSDAAPFLDQATGEYFQPEDMEYDDDDDGDNNDENDLDSLAEDFPKAEMKALGERLTPVAVALASETANWLSARNETPSPELAEAWGIILIAQVVSESGLPEPLHATAAQLADKMQEIRSRNAPPDRVAEHDRAVEQALSHLRSNSPGIKEAIENLILQR
jgi:hypothetical protein